MHRGGSWTGVFFEKRNYHLIPAVSHSMQTRENHAGCHRSHIFILGMRGMKVTNRRDSALSLNWRQGAIEMGRKDKSSPPPPQSFRCGSKQPYTLSHCEAWVAPFMTHDWNPSNVTDSAGQRSQSNKRNALTRLLEQPLLLALSHGLNRREEFSDK